MMIDKNIDKFFLRNEELEAEHEKVGKRQLDMITDEFSMEVGSPELGFGLEIVVKGEVCHKGSVFFLNFAKQG